MCRQVFRLFFVLLAIVLGTIGVLLFTLRFQLLNEDLYKNALREADVYSVLAETIDTQTKEYLKKANNPKEKPEEAESTFGPELLSSLLKEVLKDINLEKTARRNSRK